MGIIVGQDNLRDLKYILHVFFLQGIFIVRQSPMLHCEDVTMQGALL